MCYESQTGRMPLHVLTILFASRMAEMINSIEIMCMFSTH